MLAWTRVPVVFMLVTALLSGEEGSLCCSFGGCPPGGEESGDGFFNPTVSLTFRSLDPKVVPSRADDDGDSKDVSIGNGRRFKTSKESETGLDKRLLMRSKKDGGAASLAAQVAMTGDVTAQVRVAASSTAGLVDGETLGFLERRPASGDPVQRVEAVWNFGIDGFTVRAAVGGVPMGTTLDLPGAREVILFILDMGPTLALQGAEATGDRIDDFSPGGTLHFAAQQETDTAGVFAVGAEGLGKKANLWFAHVNLEFGFDAGTGPGEAGVSCFLFTAREALRDALDLLEGPEPHNLGTLSTFIDVAATSVGPEDVSGAWMILQDGLDADTLLPETDGMAALDPIKSARALTVKATTKLTDLNAAGAASGRPLKATLVRALQDAELALGLINGFRTKSSKKLGQAVDLSIH